MGRYVFTPEIFDALDRIEPGRGGELQLTDAIQLLLEEQTVYGQCLTFGRYDVGQKVDFLRANIELALDRPDLGPQVEEVLRDVMRRRGLM
jgi:UTP--glucose-1-phosphate uridylyltransferase